MTYYFEAAGLPGVEELLNSLVKGSDEAASRAINDGAVYARKVGAQEIRRKINFKAKYLNDKSRLGVTRRAKPSSLEAVVTARDRATSLARFAQGTPRFGRPRTPPRVKVSTSGGATAVRRGFYMKLRKGASLTQDSYNVGLAIRLSEGERIKSKNAMADPIGPNLYLLYGPSVGQVYRTTAEKTTDDVGTYLTARLGHYVERLIDG